MPLPSTWTYTQPALILTLTTLSIVAAGYFTYSAHLTAKQNARSDILKQLVNIGPRRLRAMCKRAGVKFVRDEEELERDWDEAQVSDDENEEERIVNEHLIAEIKAALVSELRISLRPAIETVIRGELQREILSQPREVLRLTLEARAEVLKEMRNDVSLRYEIREGVKRELRTELVSRGEVTALVEEIRREEREKAMLMERESAGNVVDSASAKVESQGQRSTMAAERVLGENEKVWGVDDGRLSRESAAPTKRR